MRPPGETLRRRYRDAHQSGAGAGFSWANEGFSFTPDEYRLVTKLNPDLAATDKETRRKAWLAFANTPTGRAFRVR
jgi:hypothetical protein